MERTRVAPAASTGQARGGYEAQKVGMNLIEEPCDMRLREIAERYGAGSYDTVGWACRGIASRTESDAKFRKRMMSIRQTFQLEI